MTDLPRFHEGEIGNLTFAHLNEVMRRLDLLYPLVQMAASGGGSLLAMKSVLFPVYAIRHEDADGQDEDSQQAKYDWWELTVQNDEVKWAGLTEKFGDDEDEEEEEIAGTQLRSGNVEEETYGILAKTPEGLEDQFAQGFCLCAVVKPEKSAIETVQTGVSYVLFPFDYGSNVPFCMITGDPEIRQVAIAQQDRSCHVYPAMVLSAQLTEAEPGTEVELIDLNSPEKVNMPNIVGAGTELTIKTYSYGTVFQSQKVLPGQYAFGQLPRFDVTCT